MSERRAHRRVPFIVPVNLVHEHRTLKGYWTIDLGEGGMRMEFLPLPIRSLVKVVVPLPAGETDRHCVLEGEVMWRTFQSTGVRFLDPPEDVLRHVRGVVEHGVPRSDAPELQLTN